MEEIQDQEYQKRLDFDNLIISGGASASGKRTRVCSIWDVFFFALSNCFLFLFCSAQPRDVKIRDATAKLAQSTITPDEFLRQVVYQSADVCNALVAFDAVATNDDEMIESLELPQEPSRTPSPQLQPIADVASPNCRVCLERPKRMALQPCGHLCLCRECHSSMVAMAMATPGPKSEKTKKKLRIKCPICREMVFACKSVPVYSA